MVTKATLDTLAQISLGDQKLRASFLDKYDHTRRYSFYTGGESSKVPDYVPRVHARNVAQSLITLLNEQDIEFYSCVPHELSDGKWKVVVILPRV